MNAATTARIATRDLLQETHAAQASITAKLRARFGDASTMVATAAKLTQTLREEWSHYAQLVRQDERDAKAVQATTDKLRSQPAPTVPVQAVPKAKASTPPTVPAVAAQKPVTTPKATPKVIAPTTPDVVDSYEQTVDSDEAFIARVVGGKAPTAAQVPAKAKAPTTPKVTPTVPAHVSHPEYSGWSGRKTLVAACKAAGITRLNRKNPELIAELAAKQGKAPVAAQAPKGDAAERKALLAKLATLSTEQLRDLVACIG